MSNDFRYTRVGDTGSYTVHAQGGSGYARLGRVRKCPTGWELQQSTDDAWQGDTYETRHAAAGALLTSHEAEWGPIDGDGSKQTFAQAAGVDQAKVPPAGIDANPLATGEGDGGTEIPMPGKTDPRPVQARYAIVEGDELSQLYRDLGDALYRRRPVRFTVHNGLRIDSGNGWTATIGRRATETGY